MLFKNQILFVTILVLCSAMTAIAADLYVYPNGAGSYPTISDAADAAATGDRIILTSGTYSGPGNSDIWIVRDLEVRGTANTIIDCGGTDTAFVVESSSAVLWDITIKNGSTTNGGAIHAYDGAIVDINYCEFLDNTATENGGAIYATIDCTVTVSESVFSNNHAGDYGGAIYMSSDCSGEIYHVTMIRNSVGSGGSATYLEQDSSLDIQGSIFAFNHGAPPCSDYYSTYYTVTCTNVYGNEAGNWTHSIGGMNGVDGNLSVDPLFCDPMADPINVVLSASSPLGSAPGCDRMGAKLADIAWTDPIYGVSDDGRGMFVTIQDAMDAIPDDAEIKLEDGIYTGPGNVDLDPVGKGMTLSARSGNAANCIIDCGGVDHVVEHSAFWFQEPIATYVAVLDLTIRNGYGFNHAGAVIIDESSHVEFWRCAFENNISDNVGGAVEIIGTGLSTALINFRACSFTDNDGRYGGAIYGNHWIGQVTDCTFTGNAATSGAGLCLWSSYILFEDNVFTSNIAYQNGGAVEGNTGETTFRGCDFNGNEARAGGAMYYTNMDLTMTACLFEDNYAIDDGGAVNYKPTDNDLVLQASNCTFIGNISGSSGSIFDVGNRVSFQLWSSTMHANLNYDPDPWTSSQLRFGGDNTIFMSSVNITGGGNGFPVLFDDSGNDITFMNSNVWGNQAGNYVKALTDFAGTSCNIQIDPLYCDPGAGVLTVRSDSQCLMANNPCNVPVGAWAEGCQNTSAVEEMPVAYRTVLNQNAPNPFNPSTVITFSIDRTGPVQLKIFDMLGREVATLVDETLAAGDYERDFRPRNLASGVYLYRLNASGTTQVKRMTLLK